MYRIILERLGIRPEDTLVVGDRLETDIAGGKAAGCPTALVLSGVTTEEMARLYPYPPTYIAADLGSLVDLLVEKRAL
jgi:ribonucleotide monophosphatase NagD (HAD superfamily)